MAQPWRNPAEHPIADRGAPSDGRSRSATELSRVKGQMEAGQNCAYNHTRGCFLGLRVVAGELSLPSLLDWISTIKAESGAGIWMIPFRGIPTKEVKMPVDLLYLDANCQVMEVVELFPTFRVSSSCPPAASVLVLPSYSISSTKTARGDQLLLCPTEEIKWRLEQLSETGSVGAAAVPLPGRPVLRPVLVQDKTARAAVAEQGPRESPQQTPEVKAPAVVEDRAPEAVDLPKVEVQQASVVERTAEVQPVVQPETGKSSLDQPWLAPSRQPVLSPLGKLSRWLSTPKDPRKVDRRPVEGLVAHFFTGGAPQAHEVRDVSPTGLYIVTSERWYPGTVIRMTLSKPDVGQAPADRSITVQTRAVRWGNDGVGLEFLVDPKQESRPQQQDPLGGANGKQLERFLKGVANPVR